MKIRDQEKPRPEKGMIWGINPISGENQLIPEKLYERHTEWGAGWEIIFSGSVPVEMFVETSVTFGKKSTSTPVLLSDIFKRNLGAKCSSSECIGLYPDKPDLF